MPGGLFRRSGAPRYRNPEPAAAVALLRPAGAAEAGDGAGAASATLRQRLRDRLDPQDPMAALQDVPLRAGAATGFVLPRRDHLITAGHVARGMASAADWVALFGWDGVNCCERIAIRSVLSMDYSAYASDHSDWAILALARPVTGPTLTAAAALPEPGSAIHAIGHPLGLPQCQSRGRLLGGNTASAGDAAFLRAGIAAHAGSSGSPVLDQQDRVIGLLSGIVGAGAGDFVWHDGIWRSGVRCHCDSDAETGAGDRDDAVRAPACCCAATRLTPVSAFAAY